jgi:hypothetical protein
MAKQYHKTVSTTMRQIAPAGALPGGKEMV